MSDSDSHLLPIIGSLLTELAAMRSIVGVLVAESPEALDALKRFLPHSDDATLNTSLDDEQREGVKAILEQFVEMAETYRQKAYPASPGEPE